MEQTGNAKIEGLTKDLHMTGDQYNIALSIFFIPYILAEVPSNMILERFKRPSIYVSCPFLPFVSLAPKHILGNP